MNKMCWLIQILKHPSRTHHLPVATETSKTLHKDRHKEEIASKQSKPMEHFTSIEYQASHENTEKRVKFEYFWPDRECGNVSFGHCITFETGNIDEFLENMHVKREIEVTTEIKTRRQPNSQLYHAFLVCLFRKVCSSWFPSDDCVFSRFFFFFALVIGQLWWFIVYVALSNPIDYRHIVILSVRKICAYHLVAISMVHNHFQHHKTILIHYEMQAKNSNIWANRTRKTVLRNYGVQNSRNHKFTD